MLPRPRNPFPFLSVCTFFCFSLDVVFLCAVLFVYLDRFFFFFFFFKGGSWCEPSLPPRGELL